MSVNQKDITLPILDWEESNISDLLEIAIKDQSTSGLFSFTERYGVHLSNILNVKNYYNLAELNFLGKEKATTITGQELLPVIRALTMIIDKFLNNTEELISSFSSPVMDRKAMQIAFAKSVIHYDVNLEDYEEEGLFVLLKSLLLVTTNALINNKIFLYINYGC